MAQSQCTKALLVWLLFAAVLLVAKAGEPHSGQFQQEVHMTSSTCGATSAGRRGLRDTQTQLASTTMSGDDSGGTSTGTSTVSVNGQSETVTCTRDAAGKATCTKNGQPYAAPPGRE
ncbi:hypothetical protein KFL_004200080 [Klebsormidium nitens]|uniref:Uncharacterized protein n=1 Tax=Klebsormidium nitens TaxID=105231 RepID=A0A1Y1IEG2_KLENI|nr:hypothetical protein KFL_004200080 [Klebsormidium nitens]|eukprot:GAQ88352.1 hypothetical protein KFL_004200080 [Klebsormidium nitens]